MVKRKTKILTTVATEPLTVLQAKDHLRVDFPDDDAYIGSLITVARDYAEGYQKKSIVGHTIELYQDYFTSCIILEKGPVKTVTKVEYILEDGTVKTIPSTDYLLTVDGKLVPKLYWPVATLQKADGVKVTYTTGEDIVPPATLQGMLILIGNWYENREPIIVGKTVFDVPFSVKSLLSMDRRG